MPLFRVQPSPSKNTGEVSIIFHTHKTNRVYPFFWYGCVIDLLGIVWSVCGAYRGAG